MMNKNQIARYSPALLLLALLQGCVYVSEDALDVSEDELEREWRQEGRVPTIGEQLEDLREALDEGLLNREEYEQIEARLIAGED